MSANNTGLAHRLRSGRRCLAVSATALAIAALGNTAAEGMAQMAADCFGKRATIVGAGDIAGTPGNDVIVGSDGADVIDGAGGDDRICSLGSDDTLTGGLGNDSVDD